MQVFLAHLSRQNNLPALAENTVSERLREHGCDVGCEVVLHMTYPDQIAGYSK